MDCFEYFNKKYIFLFQFASFFRIAQISLKYLLHFCDFAELNTKTAPKSP